MDYIAVIDKLSGAKTAIAFAKIRKISDTAQTTRLNVEAFSKAPKILEMIFSGNNHMKDKNER